MAEAEIGLGEITKPLARPVDAAAEKLPEVKAWDANERVAAQVKPREWADVQTTQSGTFTFQVVMPDATVVNLTTVSLTVEDGNEGVLSVRVAALQREVSPVEEK